MGNRTFGVLAATMVAMAALQLIAIASSSGTTGQEGYIQLKQGDLVRSQVQARDGLRSLSHVVQGTCSYVVVYSPSCGASVTAAKDWQRDALDGAAELPSAWRAYWLYLGPGSIQLEGLPAGFRWPVLRLGRGEDLQQEAQITAFPVHIVLDRAGRVVSSSVGAPSPGQVSFLDNCTISPLPGEPRQP